MVAPQAALQRRLLRELLAGPRPNIAFLSRVVGASRPATSRALHAMSRAGVVAREGRTWSITTLGKAEIAKQSGANAATLRATLEPILQSQRSIVRSLGASFGLQDLAAFGVGSKALLEAASAPSLLQ